MSLAKRLIKLTDSTLLRAVITWDKAERIRRNKDIWDDKNSLVHKLPLHYQQWYWKNMILAEASPVHYKIDNTALSWDSKRKVEYRHENVPIIGYTCPEQDSGLWGGERIVKGYKEANPLVKKKVLPRRWVPRLYFPNVRYTILYSEILDKYMKVTVTERCMRLIDKHYGLDYYLLETPDIDIDSKFGMKIKRAIYIELAKRSYFLPHDPNRHEYIKQKYDKFAIPLEEAEWRGLSLNDAVRKLQDIEDNTQPEPLKHKFEIELVEEEMGRIASGEISDEEYDLYRPQESQFGAKILDPIFEKLINRRK